MENHSSIKFTTKHWLDIIKTLYLIENQPTDYKKSNPQSMKVNIPEKCHKNWNEMTPIEKGRFCQNCQTLVVDFTKMSDAQIKDYFLENYGQKVCGKLNASQMNKDISPTPQKRLSILPKIAASVLLLAGVNQVSQSQIDANATQQKQNTGIEISTSQKETSKRIIHGKITDYESKEIAQVYVYSESLNTGVYTDKNGDFSFEIPDEYDKEQITLKFSKKDFEEIQQTYSLAQTGLGSLRVVMKSDIVNFEIKGKIIDANLNEPLIRATIYFKSLDSPLIGTTSDIEGNYSISIPPDYKGSTIELVAQYSGYQQVIRTIAISKPYETKVINIAMEEQYTFLGYIEIIHKSPIKRAWHYSVPRVKGFFKSIFEK